MQDLIEENPEEAAGIIEESLRTRYLADRNDLKELKKDPNYGQQLRESLKNETVEQLFFSKSVTLEKTCEQSRGIHLLELLEKLDVHPNMKIHEISIQGLTAATYQDYGYHGEITIRPKNHGIIQFNEISQYVLDLEQYLGVIPYKREMDIIPLRNGFMLPAIFYQESIEEQGFISKVNIGLCDKNRRSHMWNALNEPCEYSCQHKEYCGYVNTNHLRTSKGFLSQ